MARTYLFMLIFLSCSCYSITAQVKKTITVKADSTIQETLGMDMYLYPQYANGITYFKDGTTAGAKMNYNLLTDEIVFISGKDSLAIANVDNIKVIVIGKDSIYYDKGYVQGFFNNPLIKLAKKEHIKIVGMEKMGAYGQSSTASAIDSYDQVSISVTGMQKITVKQNRILQWDTQFYIAKDEDHFIVLTKKSLSDALPKYKDAIKDYLKNHSVNFNKEPDIIDLVTYLQQK